MAEYSADFDFIDDESGGRFVAVGGPIHQLRALLAKGEIDTAVKVYEETAGSARDGLIEEAKSASFDLKKSIAQMLVKARDFAGAGLVYELARIETEAAKNYEQAGNFAAAAASYQRTGELLKAAACFERGGKVNEAIELYQSAGAKDALAECLARQKRFDQAAEIFRALGNAHAEVEVLRAAVQSRQGGLGSVRRLAELMVQYGHPQKASELLMDTVRNVAEARGDAAFLEQLANALEASNNPDAAAKVRNKLSILSSPGLKGAAAAPPIVVGNKVPAPDGYGFLKALPMFAELSLPDMKSLYRSCSEVTFAPGQHLIEIGQPGKGLFVIVDGMVEVYGGPDVNSRLLNTMGAGAYVGEISLVRETPTSARVTARNAVKALFVSRDAFADYLYNNTAAALCIYRLFTQNLAERVRALSAAR